MVTATVRRLLLFGCLSAAVGPACSRETGVRLVVSFDAALVVDQLQLTLTTSPPDPAPLGRLVPDEPAGGLPGGTRVLLLLADAWAGRELRIEVDGLSQGRSRAAGSGSVTVQAGAFVDLTVELHKPGCSDGCPAGDSQCVGDSVRACHVGADGCASWELPLACPKDKPFCSLGRCAATCQNECQEVGQKRCTSPGPGFQVCEKSTSSGCLKWGLPLSCSSKELCQGGDCLPDCDGKPCPCKPGDTTSCADIGECHGGQRSCRSDGTYGPCSWTVGPTPEVCDGKDQDCSGFPDDGLVAPPCSKQLGVCKGSKQTCAGVAGWKDCDDAAYQAWAQTNGQVYQAKGDLCNGQDNDCDGVPDQGCSCQPACAGKACGADDACGHPCQSGSCPGPQDQCLSGKCVCQPGCTGKSCGADDGCGGKCSNQTCGPAASCIAGACVCNSTACGTSCCQANQMCQAGSCVPLPTWQSVSQSFTANHLNAVWGTSPGNVLAVGDGGVILRWNGSSWSKEDSKTTLSLKAIWGTGPSNIWVVGDQGAITHFDGSSWAATPPPTVQNFNAVWGSSGSNIWALSYSNWNWHYDGTSWTGIKPGVFANFTGAWGSSASNIWATGNDSGSNWVYLAHYDGSKWTSDSSATGSLEAIWGSSANDIWAVGTSPKFLHYNGSSWSEVSSSLPWSTTLYGIWGSAANDIWAVGYDGDPTYHGGRVAHYDGTTWKPSSIPQTSYLRGVWGGSSTDVWVVGFDGTLLHYH